MQIINKLLRLQKVYIFFISFVLFIIFFSTSFLKADIAGFAVVDKARGELNGPRKELWKDRIRRRGVHTLGAFVDTYFERKKRLARAFYQKKYF